MAAKCLAWHVATPLVYVDCGARGDSQKGIASCFRNFKYFGFEPDRAECERLQKQARPGYSYHEVAVGNRSESRTLLITRNKSCSSFFVPNEKLMAGFAECGPFFEVTAREQVQTVALDEYLPSQGVQHVDFLELDTQGAELDILGGARNFLKADTLGLDIEVEFAPMYISQPLFADVDSFLRQFDFILFDLLRYHVRRKAFPAAVATRGQLLWGHAFYLKDYRALLRQYGSESLERLLKLAVIASFHRVHDYALEIVDVLLAGNVVRLSESDRSLLQRARDDYLASLQHRDRGQVLMGTVSRSWFRRPFHAIGGLCGVVSSYYQSVLNERGRSYFWCD